MITEQTIEYSCVASAFGRKQRFRRILYPTDFSEVSNMVLPYVTALAHFYHSEVFVLHSISHQYHYVPAKEALMEMEYIRATAQKRLRSLTQSSALSDIEHSDILSDASAEQSILETAKNAGIDLIVMGTQGRTGFDHVLLGSTTEAVLRSAPCPVSAIRPHRDLSPELPWQTILLIADVAHETRDTIQFAVSLAHEHQAKLIVLYTFPPEPGEAGLLPLQQLELNREIATIAKAEVGLLQSIDSFITYGNYASEALSLAAQRQADLVILSEDVEQTFAFRNHATYNLVIKATCPVLILRGSSWWRRE